MSSTRLLMLGAVRIFQTVTGDTHVVGRGRQDEGPGTTGRP
jgi:hypothetical protein